MTFVDTNILLYAISTQTGEAEKIQKAKAILSNPNLTLSAQVLQEFYVQATRPGSVGGVWAGGHRSVARKRYCRSHGRTPRPSRAAAR